MVRIRFAVRDASKLVRTVQLHRFDSDCNVLAIDLLPDSKLSYFRVCSLFCKNTGVRATRLIVRLVYNMHELRRA